MTRPFFNFRIPQLETEFAARRNDTDFLLALIDELGHRSTDRAAALKDAAQEALAKIQNPRQPETPSSIPPRSASPAPRTPPSPSSVHHSTPPPVTDEPQAILDTWTALEVLSPPTFRRPEDLAGGERRAVAWLDRELLPWEGLGEKARPRTKLFYQVVLGTLDLSNATSQLLAHYADSRVERPVARGEAILAVVILDREGRLVESPAVSISSFAWGIPHALAGDLTGLSTWRMAEGPLVEGLDEALRRGSSDTEENIALDLATINAGWEWLVTRLGLPRDLVTPPKFAIRSYESYKNFEPPDPLLLNSFYLNDLSTARSLFSQGKASANLRRYLGVTPPRTRHDLLQDRTALEGAVAPEGIPPARWPGPGRHPLVLLQQAAVNLALGELRETGILAVNGPPGTGKTTLLRDLVAAVITERAAAMAAFEDPAAAFAHSEQKLKVGSSWLHLYRLDSRLKGFEMLVASSNNKAVENVSAELPDLKAIAVDAGDLRYFATLSDALRQRDTWGLVAAVLGNAGNRSRFKQSFWWDDDIGLSTYLAEASGTPQLVEINRDTGATQTRPPKIVLEENPPRSHDEALRRWQTARKKFRASLEKSRKNLQSLSQVRELSISLPVLAREEDSATAVSMTLQNAKAGAQAAAEAAHAKLRQAQDDWRDAQEKLAHHDKSSPSFFARLFRTRLARAWSSARAPLAKVSEQTAQSQNLASRQSSECDDRLSKLISQWQAAEQQRKAAAERHASARNQVKAARERIGIGFIDESFFDLDPETRHKAAPWLNAEQQRTRDDVFVAAMALHKAFIDAAAKPLRHNLGALMNTFGGHALPTPEKRALMLDLWASFFLVVPLVSTTFASVERMLGDLPPESLGWLFVDEAGQALPQAAVGALMRTRRAVLVGDPVQIEPIVVLPETLTQGICRHFGVDPDRFNAPSSSAQTLADAATPFHAEFQGRHGSRTVGIPLLVHRRCAEPMFSISNSVAYDRLMVNAKASGASRVGEILGPSAWIDIRGSGSDKWCAEEGAKVLELLQRIADAEVVPDLYVVTPFVIVAENLRKLIRESHWITKWTEDPRNWVSERIGTVHTVQGREAEAVLFVLGAPAPHQTGARNWAGGRPNLLNVAVTRAKERLYVIGNRSLWREAGLFRELDVRFPI